MHVPRKCKTVFFFFFFLTPKNIFRQVLVKSVICVFSRVRSAARLASSSHVRLTQMRKGLCSQDPSLFIAASAFGKRQMKCVPFRQISEHGFPPQSTSPCRLLTGFASAVFVEELYKCWGLAAWPCPAVTGISAPL